MGLPNLTDSGMGLTTKTNFDPNEIKCDKYDSCRCDSFLYRLGSNKIVENYCSRLNGYETCGHSCGGGED